MTVSLARRIAATALEWSGGFVDASLPASVEAAQRIEPVPVVTSTGAGVRIEAAKDMTRIADEVWVLRGKECVRATAAEALEVRDDFEPTELELQPVDPFDVAADPWTELRANDPPSVLLASSVRPASVLANWCLVGDGAPGVTYERHAGPLTAGGSSRRLLTQPWVYVVPALSDSISRELFGAQDRGPGQLLVADLLVNALGHRTLRPGRLAEPVRVVCSPGRLVIESPGCCLRSLGRADGWFPAGRSVCRNPSVMTGFRLLRMARLLGDSGPAGLRDRAVAVGFGLSAELEERCVRMVLQAVAEGPRMARMCDGSTRRLGARAVRREDILRQLEIRGELKRRELQEITGIKRTTLSKDLNYLVEKAALVERTHPVRRHPLQAYRLAPRP